MNQKLKTVVLWSLLIVLVIIVIALINSEQHERTVPFSEFQNDLNAGRVEEVTIRGRKYIYVRETETGTKEDVQTLGVEPDAEFNEKLMATNVKVNYREPEDDGLFQSMLLSSVPVILLLAAFFIIMRQMQAGGGKAMSFGKSRAKMMSDHSKKITFKDVAGIDEAREEFEEIIDFLKDPKHFQRLGGRIPKGVLLMGSPGTGKTLLARAIAGEAGVPFFSISGSDFVEMFVGVGASRVRDLFEQGKKNAPCIVFIDEIDAVGRQRGAGLGGGHDEREQTLNQLLVEMDGFEANDGVIIVAATNRPDVLDPALLRPGRFDRRIVVPNPDVKGREGILKVHTKRTPVASSVDLLVLARGTPGFSGADLENLVNEAALLAARRDKDVVEMEDFEDAKDKVLMGAERRSMIISDKDKTITAYHEAGHTIVARLLKGADPVHKVTIIPRGRALGLTQQLPTEDRLNLTKTYVLGKIAVLMGGRIAEELEFDELSTGAGQDIKTATDLARRMVCEWGMNEEVGPLYLGDNQETVFLGREIGQGKEYSESTAQTVDKEVKSIVLSQYQRARRILERNRVALKKMSEELLVAETIESEKINVILEECGAQSEEISFMKKKESPMPPMSSTPSPAPSV
ncbi:MAG: ATP-dependent zinc metalloprotease FtsH [Deltaproteobacteria bacterium]|nr:ATP-dependent zinc metalloprotease FtsH [Deltaproteobacteria bacterium]MBN2670887.1 ATP-dependent zinc metalloprotease FtsH [Deltaproteobacteria bacterium]